MSTTTRRASDDATNAPRLLITVAFAAVGVFIAAEPYIIPWATPGMQIFQGAIVFFLWLLLMFGSMRRS